MVSQGNSSGIGRLFLIDWSAFDGSREHFTMSSGSQSLDLGDAWRCGSPKSLDWDRDVESWTDSEGTSSSEQCEPGEKTSLFREDWELSRVALLPLICCARTV